MISLETNTKTNNQRAKYFKISHELSDLNDSFPTNFFDDLSSGLLKKPVLRRNAGNFDGNNLFKSLSKSTIEKINKKKKKISQEITKYNELYEYLDVPFSIIKEICSFEDCLLDNYNSEKLKLLNKNVMNSDVILSEKYKL